MVPGGSEEILQEYWALISKLNDSRRKVVLEGYIIGMM